MAGRPSKASLEAAAKNGHDWSTVGITVTDKMPVALQKAAVDNTPFPAWYEESWDDGQPRVLQLPPHVVNEAKKLVSVAANRYGRRNNVKAGSRHHISPQYVGEDGATYVDYTWQAVDRTKLSEDEDVEPEISDEEADAE